MPATAPCMTRAVSGWSMAPKRSGSIDRDRAGAHGDDVADNAADAGCGALVGLHERRRVVGLDLERHGPAVAQVGDAGVFADAHEHVLLHFLGHLVAELAQVVLRGLVGAVLAPHHRVHGEFRAGGAAAQDLDDLVELVLLQAQFGPGEFGVRGLGRVLDGVDVELPGGLRGCRHCGCLRHLLSPTILFRTEVKNPRPSVPEPSSGPKPASTACSGCGMRPTTLPAALEMPAMSRREPFGLKPT